jgi:hypothetical protein
VNARKHVVSTLWLALIILFAQGCASTLKVRIDSSEVTNNGKPLYFMARNVDAQQFLAEDYDAAADRMFHYPADPTVSATETVFPGRQGTVSIDTTPGQDVVLYFFFTKPGAKWKVPIHRPLPSEVVVELGRTQIKRVLIRKR